MLEFLYKALASPRGIVLRTSDVERARQKLYAARREACDEALNALGLTPSPSAPETELWIVKKARPDAPT
jgi:hypothetical protein